MQTMRTRSRQSIKPNPQASDAKQFIFPYGCTPAENRIEYVGVDYSGQNKLHTGYRETMTDVSTPAFHRKVAAGDVIFNPMVKDRLTVSIIPGIYVKMTTLANACTSPAIKGYTDWRADLFPTLLNSKLTSEEKSVGGSLIIPQGIISSTDVAEAVREVSTKVAANRGQVSTNLFQDIGEYKQTLATGKDVAEIIKKTVFGIPIQKIRAAANAYLLLRYGVRPLVEDLVNVFDKLDTMSRKVRQSTRGSTSLHQVYSSGVNTLYSDTIHTSHYVYTTTHDVLVRGVSLDEYVTSQLFESGFSWKGLLTLPWELLPMSFVADWFVNIGDRLNAAIPTPGFEQLGSCVVTKSLLNKLWVPSSTSAGSGYTLTRDVTGGVQATRETTQRTVGLSAPGLVVKANFGFGDIYRCGDALSLTGQRILKHLPR